MLNNTQEAVYNGTAGEEMEVSMGKVRRGMRRPPGRHTFSGSSEETIDYGVWIHGLS